MFWLFFALHAIGLRWYWGLHPLTWLGVNPALSPLIVMAAWLLWAAFTAFWWWGLWLLTKAWRQRHWSAWLGAPWVWCWGLWLFANTPFGLPWWTPGMLVALVPGLPTLCANEIVATSLLAWLCLLMAGRPRIPLLKSLPVVVAVFLIAEQCLPRPLAIKPTATGVSVQQIHLKDWPNPILLAQGNVPIAEIRQPSSQQHVGPERYLATLNQQQTVKGSLWIFPEEGALPGIVPLVSPVSQQRLYGYQEWVNQHQQFIIIGATTQDVSNHWFNSLILISPDAPIQVWHKRILVPFGEMAPLGSGELMERLSGYHPDFTAGEMTTQLPFRLQFKKHQLTIWPLLCSEAMYPDLWPKPVGQTHQMVVVSANLGWFQQTPNRDLERQWWHILKTRAIQAGITTVAVGNLGPSGLVWNQPY